ncbi:MAG: sigma 54-interacting transcriptional regulator [Gemmatimonadota bacterium]|nr:sigma 54-interacting transcriptional regulator [Gemmatimonadota bacterium]
MPILLVLPHSDSFSALWAELAEEAGAELRLLGAAEDAAPTPEVLALILSVAGVEEEAEGLLRILPRGEGLTPLVVGSAPDHRLAARLTRAGAGDYFALPGDLEALRGELAERVRRREQRVAGERLAAAERASFDFGRIVGSSVALRAALERASRVIPHARATVLLTGETGTGKELLAQAIHYNGPRAAAPFVEVNCAAIPGQLLESELFGHERGAFTDARAAKPGLFEAAHGGTLFLDEIGHLPIELQGKLLRALEEKRVRRVGSVRTLEVDVRIIAATHADLAKGVRDGSFREDLYYRLSVIPLSLPPLRERGDDVLLLAGHFLDSLATHYDVARPHLSPEIARALMAHRWPGNVRELRNGIERALLLGDGELRREDLFPPGVDTRAGGGEIPFPAALDEIERAAARAMTDRMGGNKRAAAEALGISRSRLYRLLDPDYRERGVAE